VGFAVTQAQAQTYSVIYSFGLAGTNPAAGLIPDQLGNLYGTAGSGGADQDGTVFELDTSNTETTLHTFTRTKDGANPLAPLIHDPASNFYGTTVEGGDLNCQRAGCGTVFRLNTDGKYKLLYRFTGEPDGKFPDGSLVRDAAGNLYGTTSEGGVNGFGTIFKLDLTGVETVLHSFDGSSEGAFPKSGLVQDQLGNFYGTTSAGANLYGSVFKLDTSGTLTSLYEFNGGDDGGTPYGPLLLDAAGNLYGTTVNGGTHGLGTVFKLDTDSLESVLYSFTGGDDGAGPQAPLIQNKKGVLYGTTSSGGINDGGAVFKLDPTTGKIKILHTFAGGTDGAVPHGGLVHGINGLLYGTTFLGGTFEEGTVFELSP
jgi:uncharacterized repeat protein (TIGR03803 family)